MTRPRDVTTKADCAKAPKGWRCTREAGHDGPCAAWPSPAERSCVLAIRTALQREADAAELLRRAHVLRGHGVIAQWEVAAKTMEKAVRIVDSYINAHGIEP